MQLCTINEPLLPNTTTLDLSRVEESFVPFIPLFLSPRVTSISFKFNVLFLLPESILASVIADMLAPCPNLQDLYLRGLPRDPMITTAVSSMVSATNGNTLREFRVDSPLTEEAREVVYKSQNLRGLSVVVEKGTPIPSALLPNLTYLQIECEDGSDGLQLLHRATFGKLETLDFDIECTPIDNFLEAFNKAALSSSIQNTLLVIFITTDWPWNPHYSSLLPFTRLVELEIRLPCYDSCSAADDSTIIELSQAMPELQSLRLCDEPCDEFAGGATAKGLVALAHNCPNLRCLCVHFQAASLCDPPMGLETARDVEYSASWTGCALTDLEVGRIPVPEGLASIVALVLLRIFPRIETISSMEEIDEPTAWRGIEYIIHRSKQIVDCSSKYRHLTCIPRISPLTLFRSQIHGW